MSLRNERVRKELMREIAEIIRLELKDPRISGIVSITDIEVAHDNSFAKVFYSVFSINENDKEKTVQALEENTSRIRYEVGKRITLRHVPELKFFLDDSLERGVKMTDLINKISRGEIK
ncbi:30S ribosome-binding factor RbfA [bacterium]|nr:30S ribosome-binding factor RbfA [bacterium]